MKESPPVPPASEVRITLLPLFEPFIPVPVVVELDAREGWSAFVAAVRDRDRMNPRT